MQGSRLINFCVLESTFTSHACFRSQILAANLVHNDILNVEVRCHRCMQQRMQDAPSLARRYKSRTSLWSL